MMPAKRGLGAIGLTGLLIIGSFIGLMNFTSENAQGQNWDIQAIDIGISPSIAIGLDGSIHISYYDKINKYLNYTKWNGINWITVTVDSNDSVGMDSSITLDINGYPHISYFDNKMMNLKYARWNGSEWKLKVVDFSGWIGSFSSIALDDSDYPHISYFEDTIGNLKYARWNGSTWTIETVDSIGNVGWWTSIAIDTNDNPHISYYHYGNAELKYARWNGANWDIEVVDNSALSDTTSIALDGNNNVHIGYTSKRTYDNKKFVTYAIKEGSDWEIKGVEHVSSLGGKTAIAIDSNGNPQMAYYDSSNSSIRWAWFFGGEWSIDTVEQLDDYKGHLSLAIDDADVPHIAYNSIRYAKRAGVPTAPLNFHAIKNDGQVILNWNAPAYTGTSPIEKYNIYRRTKFANETLIASVNGTLTYTDTEVEGGNTYYYRISATNDDGEGAKTSDASVFLRAFPWLLVSIIIMTIIIVLFLIAIGILIERKRVLSKSLNFHCPWCNKPLKFKSKFQQWVCSDCERIIWSLPPKGQ